VLPDVVNQERYVIASPGYRPRVQQERTRATRERILRAATALFIRDGYLATTMAAVAGEAGVAVQSLYLRFGSKLEILKAAFDAAVVGDLEPVPLLERQWFTELSTTPTGPAAMRVFLREITTLLARTYPIYAVIQAAAASEAGELLADIKRQRYEGIRKVAEELSRKTGFARDVSVDTGADMIYSQVSEEQYGLLVADRGWSSEEWARWSTNILIGSLFAGTPSQSKRRGRST